MNFERRLRQLNEQFAKFGRNPYGELNIKWSHTSELYYLISKGHDKWDAAEWEPQQLRDEKGRFAGRLFLPQYKYERHSWAETGHGPCWILSIWQPPVSEDEWLKQVGRAFPWPHRGDYAPIENIALDPGQEPDDFWTKQAVMRIEYELGMTPKEAVEQMLDRYRKQKQSVRNEIADECEDAMTAFGKIPGSKDSLVSLPTPTRLIAESGGTPLEPEIVH